MGEIIPFDRPRSRPERGPWRVVTIESSDTLPGSFDICAWDDAPSKASSRMYLGAFPSLQTAASEAHAYAQSLGIAEVCVFPLTDEPGGAA